MKHILVLLLSIFISLLCPAQRQGGYVKTPGRLGPRGELIAGKRIPGATLYFRDISAVGSGGDGTFTFAVPGKSFVLTRVQKKDYELADRDLLGKTHSPSDEPFVVVMDTPDALLAQRLANERRLRRTLQRQLQAREDEIEALREQHRITEDEYHKKLQELYASQENNEKLIADMAERYARMDFDRMDDFRRRVAACIQSGDLTRADSLLSTKGSVEERIAELSRMDDAIRDDADDLARRQEAHNKSVALRAKTLEDIAADCYNRSEICLMEHKNDSAAYYLELRANTDTLNAQWQNDAGRFIDYYVGDYDKAKLYYNRILQIPSLDDGWKAVAYNNIGHIYAVAGKYKDALEYHNKALKIRLDIFDENHFDVANSYNNIGGIYDVWGEWSKAIEYFGKALKIRLTVFGENHPDVANSYNNLGSIYISLKNYASALEYVEKALKIQLNVFGEKHAEVAISYNNLGYIYSELKKFEKALEYHSNALKIRVDIFGMHHSDVALSYNNLGFTYSALGEYDKALEYNEKALKTRISIFSEKHPDVANSYNNIGYIYSMRREYNKALEYYNKALEILREVLGPNHPNLAICFKNIGSIYSWLGIYDKALEYNERALKIRLGVLDKTHPDVADSYKNIAYIYWKAKSEGEQLPGFVEFTSEYIFTAITVDGDNPATQQGLNGEYAVLEFGDWNIKSESCLWDKNNELRGKPKTIVVMKDNKITQHNFENSIGIQLGYKRVGRAERQRILDEYHKWKAQQ